VKVHGPAPTSLTKPQKTTWAGVLPLASPITSCTHPVSAVKSVMSLFVTNATQSRLPAVKPAGASIDSEFANAKFGAPVFTTDGGVQLPGVSFTVRIAPAFTTKTSERLAPSIVTLCSVSSIVKLPGDVFATAGRGLVSVIVPLTLKSIVSVPVPAAQSPPVVSDERLALLIALRRLHRPSPDVLSSLSVFTVIMLEVALRLVVKTKTLHGSRTASRANMNLTDTRASERPVSVESAP
jgi:hypothetical protein